MNEAVRKSCGAAHHARMLSPAVFGLCLFLFMAALPGAPLAPSLLHAEEPGGAISAESGEDEGWLDELEDEEEDLASDPLYYWNRAMYHVNDTLYFWVLKPAATGYRAVTPEPVREGIRNFFNNLGSPARFINCLLQGKTDAAGVELGRFMVNTTVGILGFWNAADTEENLKRPPREDMGQSLAVLGVGEGCFLVWPIFGPSTVRDTAGMVADGFLTPLTYVDPEYVMYGARAVDTVNDLSYRLGDYEALKNMALDPYEAFRDAYLQNRKKKIQE
ncbi:MAG: VacJ family lipoprotein [Desulfobacterales bacterium]|nr:MAG: VacJ family lipoprotein [Desulfobacterales bacterium]